MVEFRGNRANEMQQHKCAMSEFRKRRQIKDLGLVVIPENPAKFLKTIFNAALF